MYSIKNNSIYTYEIKKSKFITLLFRVDNIEEIDKYLEYARNEYKNATHYCFAYKIGSYKKASDDNEPSGTAGLPILEVLDKKNLDHILCIVVRYFGGIKLGAGGLLRAYSNSVVNAINENEIVNLVESYILKICTDYENKKNIEYEFKDNIIDVNYLDTITYTINIKKSDLDKIKKYNYKIVKESFISE